MGMQGQRSEIGRSRPTTTSAVLIALSLLVASCLAQGCGCNAAIDRYCADHGFVSGFGPIENDGDIAWVACVRP